MANTRDLVKRRKAIRNIRKITRTMELIATARFKKALDRAVEAEAYTRKIAELAADLSATAGSVDHPLLKKREDVKNSLLLVLCSNRGLCGGYNASILREANQRIRQVKADGATLHLELSGKKAITYYRYQGVPADRTYVQFEDKPRADETGDAEGRGYDEAEDTDVQKGSSSVNYERDSRKQRGGRSFDISAPGKQRKQGRQMTSLGPRARSRGISLMANTGNGQ